MVRNYDTRAALNNYIRNNGIKLSFIANKTGISIDKLSMIFLKKRRLTADEFLSIVAVLGVDIKTLVSEESEVTA